jgi:transcriptional regulator with XRE-family HTH domain
MVSTTEEQWDPRLRQLGEYIRMQRHLADLSLRGLSELTQVSNAYLSQLERGLHQPSLRVLQSIAEALNLSAETLVAQAGLSRPPGSSDGALATDTETAIRNDPDLTAEAREALLRVYQSFKQPRLDAGS